MQTRRQFMQVTSTGALALGIGEVTMGLSCANVFVDIEKYVPIGLSAFQTVVSLIDPPLTVPVAAVITLIKAGFADLTADVTAYQNAPAADKATLEAKISEVITIIQNNIQQFWNDVKLPDGKLAATIEGLLGVILSTLASFLPSLPPASAKAQHLAKTITYTPVKRSAKQFKKDCNSVLAANGYSQRIY